MEGKKKKRKKGNNEKCPPPSFPPSPLLSPLHVDGKVEKDKDDGGEKKMRNV